MPAIEIKYNTPLTAEDYPVAVLRCPYSSHAEWTIWHRPHEANNEVILKEKCWWVRLPYDPGLPL